MFDGDLVRERARITPGRTALVSVESGERLTYAQFDARVEQAAATLLDAGLESGDRVGLLAWNCLEFVELFFGAMRMGAIVVPLSTRATAHELQAIADDCGMRVLFHGPEFSAIAEELGLARHLVSEHRSSARVTSPAEVAAAQRCAPADESLACLLYTSGTTGKPKGVMIPRRQLFWNGYNTVINWGLREDDVSSIFTPLYHAGGLAVFLIPLFCAGGTIVIHKTFDANAVWDTIVAEGCTVVLGVPTIWKMLMDAPAFATADVRKVRWFISGGAPLPAYVIEGYQSRGIPFKQGYGMTEVGVNCFTTTEEASYSHPGSIGHPMLFTEVTLVDEQGTPVAIGEIGEMWIRGPHVSKGYWGNEAATRDAYGDDGWFHTGDLARRDEEGFYYIAGRRKEMFISGGVNVYPAEIEAQLVAHPDVADAAVIALPDDTWGEVPVAFIVGNTTAETLGTYLSSRIAKYKVPKRYVFLQSLPRTPYGKVLKGELQALVR